jgi:hypothetical protein
VNTAQTVLTQGAQTAQVQTLSTTALWIAAIAGVVLLVWLVVARK